MMRWAIGIAVTVAALLANPNGPWGSFWLPASGSIGSSHALFPYFVELGMAEAVALGIAVSLLLTAFPKNALPPLTVSETKAGFLALVWNLGNWWLHDSLHLHFGAEYLPLLFIEYAFHATMMLSSAYLLYLAGKLYRGKKK